MESIQQQIMNEQASQMSNKRDAWFLNKLKEAGYYFDHKSEMIEFIKTRCHVVFGADKFCTLYVDKQMIARWYDTISTVVEISENSVKSTITYGLPPEKSNNLHF